MKNINEEENYELKDKILKITTKLDRMIYKNKLKPEEIEFLKDVLNAIDSEINKHYGSLIFRFWRSKNVKVDISKASFDVKYLTDLYKGIK